MLKVIWNELYSNPQVDKSVPEYVKTLINHLPWEDLDINVYIAQETVINEFRLAVARGQIAHDKIVLCYNDEEVNINPDGSINNWPVGFCEFHEDQLMEILDYKWYMKE